MKILITGGAGFIGSHLAIALSAVHDVYIVDNLSFGYINNLIYNRHILSNFYCSDIRSTTWATLDSTDIIIHLAGISSLPICQEQPMLAYDINTAGVANVLEMARRLNAQRVIFSSTSAVYENTHTSILKETDHICPDLIYASTKYAAEHICQSYANNYGIDIIIARFSNVYGPHQNVKRISPPFTSYLIRQALNDEQIVLYNSSKSARDYIYISDVIDVLTRMIMYPEKSNADIYNICSGNSYTVPQIVAQLSKILDKELDIVYKDPTTFWDKYPKLFEGRFTLNRERIRDEVNKAAILDNTKATQTFLWTPVIEINKGLENIVNDEITNSSMRR